jgi:hypothetical protein
LEKALRAKRQLEQEIEKMANESIRANFKDNASYEDLHKRYCNVEKEKDQALIKLEAKDSELKKFQSLLDIIFLI